MFLTMDSNEVQVSSEFAGPGLKCWRAVQIELSIPLLFPTWSVNEDGYDVHERALLSFEGDLIDLISNVGPKSLVRLQYLAPPALPAGNWNLRTIHQVWRSATKDEVNSPLLFQDDAGVRFVREGGPLPTGNKLLWRQPQPASDVVHLDRFRPRHETS